MNRFSRLLALLMSLCLMVSLLASCGGNTDSGGSTADAGKDTFTVALDSDIVKLDPAFAYDFTTNPVVNQITQGLLTFDEDNRLQPMLASSCSVSSRPVCGAHSHRHSMMFHSAGARSNFSICRPPFSRFWLLL